MITCNPQWLELPMSLTNFHGPKDVRALEVRLYYNFTTFELRGKDKFVPSEKRLL